MITQLFFDNDDYRRSNRRHAALRAAGMHPR